MSLRRILAFCTSIFYSMKDVNGFNRSTTFRRLQGECRSCGYKRLDDVDQLTRSLCIQWEGFYQTQLWDDKLTSKTSLKITVLISSFNIHEYPNEILCIYVNILKEHSFAHKLLASS